MRYVLAWLVLSAAVGCAVDPEEDLVAGSSAPIINGVRETGARWVVAVVQRDWSTGTGGLCSGSVIGPYAVMTAKHCVFDGSTRVSPSELLVVVGDDVTTAGGAESFHGVVDIRTTPGTNIDLDIDGVGRLVELACREGKKANPSIVLGLCGEHGGDPDSIKFVHGLGLDSVSCSPPRVEVARLAAAQAELTD